MKSLARLAAEEAFSALCVPRPAVEREVLDHEPWGAARQDSPERHEVQPSPNDARAPRVFRLPPTRTETESDANAVIDAEAAVIPVSGLRKIGSDKRPGPVHVVYVAEAVTARVEAAGAADAAPLPSSAAARRASPSSPERASAELEARIHANLESAWQRSQDDSFREVSKRLTELDAVLAGIAFARSFRASVPLPDEG